MVVRVNHSLENILRMYMSDNKQAWMSNYLIFSQKYTEQSISVMASLFNFRMIERVIMPLDVAFPLPNSDYV